MKLRVILIGLLILLVGAAYLGAGALVLWLPCQGELLIGFCELGKIIFAILGLLLLAAYLGLVILLQRRQKLLAVLLVSLIFLAIPLALTFGVLRRAPALQPYALPSLRQNGQQQVEFVSFSDTPVNDAQTGQAVGFITSGVVRVKQSGQYEIYPMNPKGEVYTRVLSADGERLARVESVYLQAGEDYPFEYFVEFQIGQAMTGCIPASWKVFWRVQSIPPFPWYLFGRGVFAQVYPDDSGEYAYVTHINPGFQTGIYQVCP